VRAPRSAQLKSALVVARMLDPMANFYEVGDLDLAFLDTELDPTFPTESRP
jgi:hypothetical protein